MPDFVTGFLEKYGSIFLTALIVFIATWYWRSRDRKISKKDKKKDRKGTASRQENIELAETVERLRDKTAEGVEEIRVKRSLILEAGHDALIQEIKDLQGELQEIREEQAIMRTQISPLWAAVQARLIKDLTHPHPQFKNMDDLLKKLADLGITEKERIVLEFMLEERIVSPDPEVSADEKDSAGIMKTVMRKVLQEKASSNENQ